MAEKSLDEIKKKVRSDMLKEWVRPDMEVHFKFYRAGYLYYETDKPKVSSEVGTLSGAESLLFPVPIDDCGDGVFKRDDKAILFMRYIRKHMEDIYKDL